jgi:hypothetical protein
MSADINRLFLGFDVRLCRKDYDMTGWDKEDWLLRVDVAWPLSIDVKVWPSAFDQLMPSDFPDNATHPSTGFWFDLEMMLNFLNQPKMNQIKCGIPISVELVTDEDLSKDPFWASVLYPYGPLSPNENPARWILLGYDVADRSQLSGLMNCGYDPNEIADLRLTWKDRLNEHGLFSSPGDAIRFKRSVDLRVREHAPFYVYALYRDPVAWEMNHD